MSVSFRTPTTGGRNKNPLEIGGLFPYNRRAPRRALKRRVNPSMSKYAIIEAGGKQYRVEEGRPVITERLRGFEAGDPVVFDRVLLVRGEDEVKVGRPYVEGARVVGTVTEEFKGEKVHVFKYKPKKRYRRRRGHRQIYLKTLIEEIQG